MISCNNVVKIKNKSVSMWSPHIFLLFKAIFQSDESKDEKHNMNKDWAD